jgi:hypothetical protein
MICCHGKPLHRAVRPDAYNESGQNPVAMLIFYAFVLLVTGITIPFIMLLATALHVGTNAASVSKARQREAERVTSQQRRLDSEYSSQAKMAAEAADKIRHEAHDIFDVLHKIPEIRKAKVRLSNEFLKKVQSFLETDNRNSAIKLYRHLTGASHDEAEHFIKTMRSTAS